MDEKAVKAGIQGAKKYYYTLGIAILIAVIGFFIYDSFFGGGVSRLMEFGQSEMYLRASNGDGAYEIRISYADITGIELLDDKDFVTGEMVDGVQGRTLWCGKFRNSAYGEYDLYADPRLKVWLVITTKDGVTLFNSESRETTSAVGEEIRKYMS